jgi:hypothetical protein
MKIGAIEYLMYGSFSHRAVLVSEHSDVVGANPADVEWSF